MLEFLYLNTHKFQCIKTSSSTFYSSYGYLKYYDSPCGNRTVADFKLQTSTCSLQSVAIIHSFIMYTFQNKCHARLPTNLFLCSTEKISFVLVKQQIVLLNMYILDMYNFNDTPKITVLYKHTK